MCDPARFLFAQRVELATLDAGQVEDRRLQQPREEVTDDQRDRKRVPAEDHLEQPECRLTRILLRHACTNRRTVLADLLGPLDAGQFAQLLQRIRHRLRIVQVEILDGLEPLARKQLHRRT